MEANYLLNRAKAHFVRSYLLLGKSQLKAQFAANFLK